MAAAPARSFGQWFRQLNSNPYLAVCMAVTMPSGAANSTAQALVLACLLCCVPHFQPMSPACASLPQRSPSALPPQLDLCMPAHSLDCR